ncbi:hypothetical protein ABTF01_21150, partial [Acinetobacter baumannii]
MRKDVDRAAAGAAALADCRKQGRAALSCMTPYCQGYEIENVPTRAEIRRQSRQQAIDDRLSNEAIAAASRAASQADED